MSVWAFDAKEFTRTRVLKIPVQVTGSNQVSSGRERCFHTPLGVGIKTSDEKSLENALRDVCEELKKTHKIESLRPFAPSTIIRTWCQEKIGQSVVASERIVEQVAPHLSHVHFSFAALSSNQMITVPVGGYASPVRQLSTSKFLESICPMFSYLTAWTCSENGLDLGTDVRIDAFSSKQTMAWSELISKCRPTYYYRGDEVDPLICFADILAFATDRLLYRNKMKLEPNNLGKLWDKFGFEVSSWIVGKGNAHKVAWVSDEMIDVMPFVRRPVVFILRDSPDAYKVPSSGVSLSSLIQGGLPFEAAVNLAASRHAALKFFNEFDDPRLIKDGDVFVYAGPKAKQVVGLYVDMYDVEAYSFKEVRELVSKQQK